MVPDHVRPTKEEAEAISVELKDFKFPRNILAGRPEAQSYVEKLAKSEGQMFFDIYDSPARG